MELLSTIFVLRTIRNDCYCTLYIPKALYRTYNPQGMCLLEAINRGIVYPTFLY